MHIRLIAVGDRQPAWVNSAFSEFMRRLPKHWGFSLVEIAPAVRKSKSRASHARRQEADRILSKLSSAEWVVALDENGRQFTSSALAHKIAEWQAIGHDIAFIIGGPDGLSRACLERANVCWSLSKLTLPHGLARVLFIEQLYRAWSLSTGHPYHRA